MPGYAVTAGARPVLGQYAKFDTQCLALPGQRLALHTIVIDAEHLYGRLGMLREAIELGNFLATGAAPFRPVIDQQPLAFELASRYLASMLIDTPVVTAAGNQEADDDGQNKPEPHRHAWVPRRSGE